MSQFAFKLAMNSIYGKMAQQIGRPPYHQLEWAGYVTSYTRGRLLFAAMRNVGDILSFATDGIYSRSPLQLPCSEALGEWEYKQHDGITLVQSGVYWTKDGEQWTGYRRGFAENLDKPEKQLSREKVMNTWQRGENSIETEYTRFVTMRSVVAGLSPWKDWRHWVTMQRELSITSNGKRYSPLVGTATFHPDKKLIRTYAVTAESCGQEMSAPFPLKLKGENWQRLEDILSDEGEVE